MGGKSKLVFTIVMVLLLNFCSVKSDIASDCSTEVEKVTPCLNYATGKEAKPAPACCSSVEVLKDSDPKCLCYIIQQTHNGSEQIKNLGIQEAKLLQLPSACQLKNASISFCPKLLGISPSSPDAAIYLNTTITTPSGAATETSSPDKAVGTMQRPYLHGPLAIAMAIFVYIFIARSST